MTASLAQAAPVPVVDDVRAWMSEGAEHTATDLPVQGHLPVWLEGTLLRNGAGGFGEGAARHVFDGSALLHRFAFRDGRVDYTSRFLQTKARRGMVEGRIALREFASDPCRRFAEPITALFSPRYTDNANVSIARLGREFLALTETPMPVRFDPETLATLGIDERQSPGLGPRSPSAHPHVDAATGDWTTTQVHFGAKSSTRVYVRSASGGRAKLLAKLPTDAPSYLHSFAVTQRHVVLIEQPFRVRSLELARADRPFVENYRWEPELGSRIVVLDRSTGALLSRHAAPPWFVFHHANAFDDGSEIVLDVCTYDDAGIVDALYFDELRRDLAAVPQATLRRIRVRPGTTADATASPLTATPFEWPRVDDRLDGQRHHAVYGSGVQQRDGAPVATIVRVDPERGTTHEWGEHRAFPGEPVFVPRPGGTLEDDGVVLSVVFDAAAGTSFLLVLDARDLSELARVTAPGRIPFGFHGGFYADV